MPAPACTIVPRASAQSSDGYLSPSTFALRRSQQFSHTEDENCGLWSLKLPGCRPISVEQFAIGAKGYITDCWTVHQRPAKNYDAFIYASAQLS